MNNKEINILKKSYKKESDGKIKERILMLIHSYEGKLREMLERCSNVITPLCFFGKKDILLKD